MNSNNENVEQQELLDIALFSYIGYRHVQNLVQDLESNREEINKINVPKSLDKWFYKFNSDIENNKRKNKYKNIFKNTAGKVAVIFLVIAISMMVLTVSDQEVIDKLNLEYNANILIPSDGKEEVYSNVKDKTVEEFEKYLRRTYEEIRLYEGFHEITTDYSSQQHIPKNTDNAIRVSAKTSKSISNIQLFKDDVGIQSIRERIIQEYKPAVG